ncbi:retinal rod rhodopsin-sensitive cGMP 3',5'-cyclic phosphodiesterase subunit gamma [Rhea pennata]|uniref:retinal rod rhodopsin-sensitive cGMP 3',5'-cyclic phosphodiesterase subunit gamma n=1 Tax=Rhea pennata TaxID=8795 RepID=UPI002E26E7C8
MLLRAARGLAGRRRAEHLDGARSRRLVFGEGALHRHATKISSLRKLSDNTTKPDGSSDAGPATPRKGPPKFKQRQTRQFKSKPPKKGVQGFGDDIPGMEGLGTDITVICPWEAFSHLELHELAQYGII